MLTALVLALGVLTGANLLLLFAVLRRLREVEQRTSRSAPASTVPAPGTRVGDWHVVLADGTSLSAAEVGPDVTALFLSPGCRPCTELVAELADHPDRVPAGAVAFVAGDADDPAARQYRTRLPGHIRVAYVENAGGVVEAFGGIAAFPAVITVRDGHVVASGHALDEHEHDLVSS